MSSTLFTLLGLTLIGGPTVVIDYHGLRLVTDPTFDSAGHSYTRNAVTLEKKIGPALDAGSLGRIDVVLLSHDQHADNLDDAGREVVARVPLTLTTQVGAARLGGQVRGLSPGESVEMLAPDGKQVKILAVQARHGPTGVEPFAGDVIGFVLQAEGGPSLYVTGDTVYYEGVADTLRTYKPDIVLAFAGAARVRGPFDLTMGANDLLDTAHASPNSLIVPVHLDGWAHFTLGMQEVERVFATFGLSNRLVVLQPGKSWTWGTP